MSTDTAPSSERRGTSATTSTQPCVVDGGPRDLATPSDHRPTDMDANGYRPPPGVLRLTIGTQGGGTELALIPFPETYALAQKAAVEVLAPQLRGALPENIELRGVTKDRDGSWTTAAILPRDWLAIVPICYSEVRVTRLDAGAEEDETPFFSGLLKVTAGMVNGAVMEWTPFHQWGTINRPVSYEDALNLIERLANANRIDTIDIKSLKKATRPGYTTGEWTIPRDGTVKICTFPATESSREGPRASTRVWLPLPAAAYTSPACWRKHMPGPESLIGVACI